MPAVLRRVRCVCVPPAACNERKRNVWQSTSSLGVPVRSVSSICRGGFVLWWLGGHVVCAGGVACLGVVWSRRCGWLWVCCVPSTEGVVVSVGGVHRRCDASSSSRRVVCLWSTGAVLLVGGRRLGVGAGVVGVWVLRVL
jgi:hypothetical protein